MLDLKQLQHQSEDISPRWSIGIDRRHVVAYVAIALIVGATGGFLAGSYLARKEPTSPLLTDAKASVRNDTPSEPVNKTHRVTKIIRGDTIEVDGSSQIHLIGVETPDGKSPREIYGVHGQRALDFAQKTLLGQDVRLETDNSTGGEAKDETGATMAYVYLSDGTLINAEMVKQGLAFVKPIEHRLASSFRGFEREAMQNMRGVWGSSSSGSSSSLATTPATSTPSGSSSPDKPKKIEPLPPSAVGLNIPALSGSSSSSSDQSVWVSGADKMYHKSSCDFLDKKKHPVTLSQAKSEGFTACSRCYASTVLKAP